MRLMKKIVILFLTAAWIIGALYVRGGYQGKAQGYLKACQANLRALEGATEMYMSDLGKPASGVTSLELMELMVKKGYLHGRVEGCSTRLEDHGIYEYSGNGTWICTAHGDIEGVDRYYEKSRSFTARVKRGFRNFEWDALLFLPVFKD
ncbi:MAG: hypothetical protein HQM09_19285 [Candidatus Riflebacteria bacterium]|nr:hypothetical protein [Candidatus Riflebacteria bacterium]